MSPWNRKKHRKARSLLWRLTFGYVLAHAAAILIAQLIIFPFAVGEDESHSGPRAALYFLRFDLGSSLDGLYLPHNADIWRIAKESPSMWFLIESPRDSMSHGSVPPEVRSGSISRRLNEGYLQDIGGSDRIGEAAIEALETEAGPVKATVGGIDPGLLSLGTWLRYYWLSDYFWLPVFSAFFTLTGALVALPIILGSVRPTTLAISELDPDDLQARVPEASVSRELLPIVRALNAALDRAADVLERRRRFIADIAHELRTPLAVLSIETDSLPDVAGKANVQRVTYRLGQLVAQMLDAERLGRSNLDLKPTDLVHLAKTAVADITPLAMAHGYVVSFSSEARQTMIAADPHSASRAIANLLANAVAHGGSSGEIKTRVTAQGIVEVQDEGPGVPKEARERIFEPFHREHWDRDGCGLGLHLVAEIMNKHGGEAVALPTPAGAKFRLKFSLAEVVGR